MLWVLRVGFGLVRWWLGRKMVCCCRFLVSGWCWIGGLRLVKSWCCCLRMVLCRF